jgi:multiple sugar transport system permease protein
MTVRIQPLTTLEPKKKPFPWGRLATYVVLIITSAIMAYPLVFSFLASMSTPQTYLQATWLPLPNPVTFETYTDFFQIAPKAISWIGNTLIRIAWYIVIPATIAVLCGYVFAKLRFKGRDTIFMILLTSMMIPGIVYYISNYIMMARWPLAGGNNILGQGGSGFVNQWPSVLLVGLLNVYYIFLMRQTFYSIPRDFEEAALVDGATRLQVLWKIYLPMLLPSLTVLVIFQTVAIWNDYVWPLMAVGGNTDIQPVALAFQRLMAINRTVPQAGSVPIPDYPWTFTIATLATLPMILMFFRLQRYFVEGSAGFAIKG